MILLRAFGDRAIALLWGGLATSSIGDQLFAVVLSWVAVGVFGTAAGYLSAMQAAALLATLLLAGRWADRQPHLWMMIGADLARAAVLLVLVAAWVLRGSLPPGWSLFAAVMVLAAGLAVFRPAMQASMPLLVRDPALLPGANALLDSTERIARLLGPGLVGLVSALVPLVHFVTLDAATFAVSAAAIAAIARFRPLPHHAAALQETMVQNVLRGWRVVHRHRLLGFVLSISGLINGTWYATYFLGLPLIIERAGVTGPGGSGLAAYGLVISAYGSTNLLATLVVGNRRLSPRPARVIFGGNIALGCGLVLVGLAGLLVPAGWLLPALMAAAAVSAVGGPMQDITVAVLRQTELPRADLPAAVRAFMVSNNLGTLVALGLAPAVFNALGVTPAVVLCGVVLIAAAGLGLARFAGAEASPATLHPVRLY